MASRVKGSGRGDLQPLSVYLGAGVVRRADREDNHNVLGSDLNKYLHVQPGDLVFNKLRTWQGGLGASKYEGIVSPAYYVLRTTKLLDARFAHYTLISSPYLAELTRLSKFMPPSQFDMPWESLKRLPMLIPPFEEQRRIADFLDDQVTRIDQVIELYRTAKRLMGDKLRATITQGVKGLLSEEILERGKSEAKQLIPLNPNPSGYGTLELKIRRIAYVNPATPGFDQLPSEATVTFLPLEAVWSGRRADLSRSRQIEAVKTGYVRFTVGDVLCPKVTPTFQAGRSMVVPEIESGVGAATTEVHVIRARPGLANPRFIMYLLLSSDFLEEGVSRFQGVAGLQRVPAEFLLDFSIGNLSMAQQLGVVEFLDDYSSQVELGQMACELAIDLLEERRRALITAAITGQMDVTSARPVRETELILNTDLGTHEGVQSSAGEIR